MVIQAAVDFVARAQNHRNPLMNIHRLDFHNALIACAAGTTGLFHTAILYPTRPALADALHRVLSAGIQLDGASDHGVSQALYLRDPDENGVELYWDRPEAEWPRSADGKLSMFTRRLDLEDLLKQRAA